LALAQLEISALVRLHKFKDNEKSVQREMHREKGKKIGVVSGSFIRWSFFIQRLDEVAQGAQNELVTHPNTTYLQRQRF
jgi:phosphoserine phosphatase